MRILRWVRYGVAYPLYGLALFFVAGFGSYDAAERLLARLDKLRPVPWTESR